MTKINISIPIPCYENWERMTAVDKGKFCASCQKKVHDFTQASDREIVTAFQQNQNLCGRFLSTQLNRDLVKPKEKSSLWMASTATLVSLIGIGTHEVTAQEPLKTEQTDQRMLGKFIIAPTSKEIAVSGIVKDDAGPLPRANIIIMGKNIFSQTDFDGKFTIKAEKGDTLIFNFPGYIQTKIIVDDFKKQPIEIKMQEAYTGLIEIKRTFFGRIFHSIGNWFR